MVGLWDIGEWIFACYVCVVAEMKEWVEGWDFEVWRDGLESAGGSTRVEVKEDDEPDPMKYGDDGRNDPGYESEDEG